MCGESDGSVAACPGGDTLAAFMAGGLPEPERALLANHAAWCGECHALIEALVVTDGEDRTIGALELRRGARVGRYLIDERLGAGGMGVVYAALDTELDRRVALKLLRPDRRGRVHAGGRERLLQEARTLARLAHPNVVTVFDVGVHEGQVFVAMELIDGGSLRAWLRRTPRTADEIIDRMIGVGRGLAAAHAAGVVHRDVKPDNILVGLAGGTQVTDFGLAQLSGARRPSPEARSAEICGGSRTSTRTGTLVGTPAYMAPEHLLRGETSASTDQWSFCATLYEALAGVRPFPGDIPARLSAISDGRLAAPVRDRCVPRWVRPIVTRGLRGDPRERWPSMEALVQQLARRRPGRRGCAIVGGLAIAGIAIGAAVLGRGGRTADPPARSDASAGRPKTLLGASTDGNAILYLEGQCNADRLMMALRRGATIEWVELTEQLAWFRPAVLSSERAEFGASAAEPVLVADEPTLDVRPDGPDLLTPARDAQ